MCCMYRPIREARHAFTPLHSAGGEQHCCCLCTAGAGHVILKAYISAMAWLQSPSNYGAGVGQLLGASSQASIPVSTDSAAALDGSRRIWLSFVNRTPVRAAGSRRSDSPMPHDPSTVSTVKSTPCCVVLTAQARPQPPLPLYARLLQPLIVCVRRWLQ